MPAIFNAQAIEEEIFVVEGVRVVIVTGTRKRKLEIHPYSHYILRKLTGSASVNALKKRVLSYIDKGIVVIKGDGTVATDTDKISDIRKSYNK